jgi:transcription antitermination factor NusG
MNWYALSIAPGREAQAARRLAEDGFTVYCPVAHLVRRKHRLSKLRVVHGVPMLAGYLFVGFNEDEQPAWHALAAIDLVTGVVGAGGEPLAFPARDMAWLAFSSQRPTRYLNTGRKHRIGFIAPIVSGPYEGRTVRVIEAEGRVRELYELVRREG